jgi:AP endonuclease-2
MTAPSSQITTRLVSFNLNGLRPALIRRKGPLIKLLRDLEADIVCVQETKLSRKDLEEIKDFALADGWWKPHPETMQPG